MKEMNDPNRQSSADKRGLTPCVRLAIFDQKGDEKKHVATITLSEAADRTWNVQLAGQSDASVENLRPLLERFADERRALAETASAPQAASPPEALAKLLGESGFTVEELPAGDYTVSIQIDMKNGLVLGTNDAMHGLVPKDNPLGRQIVESLAKQISKASKDLANEISGHVAAENHAEAVAAIKRFIGKGAFGLRPNDHFFQSLIAIDVTRLPGEDRRLVRNARMEVAQRLQRFDIMGLEAEALLSEDDATLNPEERATLKMAVAVGAHRRGNKETALLIWRSLLKEPSDFRAEGRGWAWRNISMALSADDPEAKQANKHSADAFLQAGNKEEAGKSLMGVVDILMKEDPAAALTTLNEIIELLDKEGLTNRFVRAAAFHARANRLSVLHQHREAY